MTDQAKPGWKTTDFWLSLGVIVLSATVASGLLASDGIAFKIVSIVTATLTGLGYTAARAKAKGQQQ